MIRYAVYEIFGDCSLPESFVSGGYLTGVLLGTCDENPLESRPHNLEHDHRMAVSIHDHLMGGGDEVRVDNEFSPHININVRSQAEEE